MVNEHIVVYNMATDDICEGRFDEGESLLLLCWVLESVHVTVAFSWVQFVLEAYVISMNNLLLERNNVSIFSCTSI